MDVSQNLCDRECKLFLEIKEGCKVPYAEIIAWLVVVKEDASIVLTHFLHFPIGCWICC